MSASRRPWFRRRRGLFSRDLGWGYVPITCQGWAVVGAAMASIVATAAAIAPETLGEALLLIALVAVILVVFRQISERHTGPE